VITGCHPNCINGYTLVYTLNGQTDSIVYSWTTAGVYTYRFYSNGVDTATQTYNSFIPCYTLPLCAPTSIMSVPSAGSFAIYPNPSGDEFYFRFDDPAMLKEIKSVTVYSLTGETIYQASGYTGVIKLDNAAPGVYMVRVNVGGSQLSQKLILNDIK
jgi:hypothetical protein